MKNKKILIIEDEKDISMFLEEALTDEGFDVKSVSNGLEAENIMKKDSYDLVILDMLLPGEHGMDIINFIRDNFFTPIIVISGIYKKSEIMSSFEDSNVRDFFQKPFKIKDILKSINSIFNEEKV